MSDARTTRGSLPLSGGCQCGRIRYEITEEPLTLYACHCTECQRQSGSGHGLSMPVLRAGLRLLSGEPRSWRRTSDSGRDVDCVFCGDCGTRLFHLPSRNPRVANVKPGTLDDTRWLRPVGHLWTGSAQPWVSIADDALAWEGQPDDFSPLFEAWKVR